MAKLILKSPYLKSGGKAKAGAGGYLHYIATRENVEKLADQRPATRRQEQLVSRLTRDFPESKDLLEYGDYAASHTKAAASAFITIALEQNWQAAHETEFYMKYIATRPRVERLGKEYLCGENTAKDVEWAMEYFRQAAEAGNQYAQSALGKLYLQGREVARDQDQAVYWLSLSAAQGNAYAQTFLERMEQNRQPALALAATRILRDVARVFRDNSLPPANPSGPRIDSKRRRQLMEKRMAQGQKLDDSMQSMG